MQYLNIKQVLLLHKEIIETSGGSFGLRDEGALDSALAQPRATFAQQNLYETLTEKAAALGFSIIQNHAFVDGNKRVGTITMQRFLLLNGYKIQAHVDEQEQVILRVAASEMGRDEFTAWLGEHIVQVANSM